MPPALRTRSNLGDCPLSRSVVLSGFFAAVPLALGLDAIAPLGGPIDTLCDLAGVASGALFIGLADGA